MNTETIKTVAAELSADLGDDYRVTTSTDSEGLTEIHVTTAHAAHDDPYIVIDQPYADQDDLSVNLFGWAPGEWDPKHIDSVPFDEDEDEWLADLVDALADAVTDALPV